MKINGVSAFLYPNQGNKKDGKLFSTIGTTVGTVAVYQRIKINSQNVAQNISFSKENAQKEQDDFYKALDFFKCLYTKKI